MRILLVKLRHIGDSLITTSVAQCIKDAYPDSEISLMIRKGTEGILHGCPQIDHLLTTAAPEQNRRLWKDRLNDLRLLRRLRRTRFDFAIDLGNNDRGRTMVGLSGAKQRCLNHSVYKIKWPWKLLANQIGNSDWRPVHRVEADYNNVSDFIDLGRTTPGPLIFQKEKAVRPALELPPPPPWVVIHPGTRWKRKQWDENHWIELGKLIISHGIQVVVSVGPDPEEIGLGDRLVKALGSGSLSTGGKLTWPNLAWLLCHAAFFVGVDTAAMHLAAAMGCPTVALFGPDSNANNWHPWQVPYELIRFAPDDDHSLHKAKEAVRQYIHHPPKRPQR
ncbi:glycosyltransferase family 9 protein [Prosthecobacter sp.]